MTSIFMLHHVHVIPEGEAASRLSFIQATKWLRYAAIALVLLSSLTAAMCWWLLSASLPAVEGKRVLSKLNAEVRVDRDSLGTATIHAVSELDAMRALGYIHAQERYFEMDLMRRTAAGELAELLGPSVLDADRKRRIHRFRYRAFRNLSAFAAGRERLLDAYVEGVNAGLGDLTARPWPYLLLGHQPRPWSREDSALVGYAMYVNLQDASNARELALQNMEPHLPPEIFRMLVRDGTRWDAPLMGQARGDARLPDASTVDLRRLAPPQGGRPAALDTSGTPGSNNFAVAGALTADGRAILADDMHSKLGVPNIWFRARLRYGHSTGAVDVSGFTLPGLPIIVAGSNGWVAWGFTNGYADTLDWDPHCGGSSTQRCTRLLHEAPAREVIRVKGRGSVEMEVFGDEQGPVIVDSITSRPMQLHWTAYATRGLNLNLGKLHYAADIRQALAYTRDVGLPTANLLLSDRKGAIAWTMIGPTVPARDASDCQWPWNAATRPLGDVDGAPSIMRACGGIVGNGEHVPPSIASPSNHRLWTANNRTLDGPALNAVGDGGYAHGARALQVRNALMGRERFSEKDLLAIQLDDSAAFLEPWWQLMQAEAAKAGRSSALSELAEAARHWEGRASVGSVSYRLVRSWRLAVLARIVEGLTAPAQAALKDRFVMPQLPQIEGVAWPLVTRKPIHLLSRRYDSWPELFEDAAKEVRDELAKQGPLGKRTWGERNTARICHSLASAVPLLGKQLLCMPRDQMPGDSGMPRVQGPAFGATQRMVVSPGHEHDGIAHMPGGQSGHVLSPFWGAGHEAWVNGRRSSFLPGRAVYSLTLVPATN